MICPVCGHENLEGLDNCDNCGADLRTADIPHPGTEFEAELIGEHLWALRPAPPLTVDAATPVAEAIARMQEADSEYVLVMEGDRLAGIFTERDALLKLARKPLDGIRIDAVMTRDPVVLRAADSIAVALHKMAVGGFRHIPLVDGGRPTGVVTSRDLFRHIINVLG